MSPKKIWQIIITNLLIIMANIAVFSKAFFGLSLFLGSTLSISIAWFTIIGSIISFTYFNKKLLMPVNSYTLI